ncbi:Pfs, NACHT and ankyrin domain protein [Stachybotrys elegans]|uniref:Pfs, NACHT and ankyrin domain protein n=1 Tax=Stachybotrys elegans TaxID=80388 RepID=A0A8K0SIK1_9HYPO|nr:Pfs, NACHT and ankyrin domain protein [Stachybotrys elegans]
MEGPSRLPPPTVVRLVTNYAGFSPNLYRNYSGRLTSNRVEIMGTTIFKAPALSSSIEMYGWVNSTLLGASRKAMGLYYKDNSGPFPQPHPKSNIKPHNRVDYITHHGIFRGLTGPGLQPTTIRYTQDLCRCMQAMDLKEWVQMPDLMDFFREVVGAGTLKAVVGPTMFRLNPTFARDMFRFDKIFPSFAPGFPRLMMSGSYAFRDKLANDFKKWYQYANNHFDESLVDEDGEWDPIWGSSMMRQRQSAFSQADHHDDETIARIDLGLAWATIGNIVPLSMFAVFHVFKDKELQRRVRREIQDNLGDQKIEQVDVAKFVKAVPLLSSIYAETLRLYVKVYSLYRSPHDDVQLGRWVLPKGAVAVLNSGPSHMDPTFWNTMDGKHPVDSFWADRFLVDPSDPQSGPVNPECRETTAEKRTATKPYFSTEGCEGAWIPYGGGYSMCPGRFIAKSVLVFTTALLVSKYDIEIDCDKPRFTNKRYGMGVEDLKYPIPFRIKRRVD